MITFNRPSGSQDVLLDFPVKDATKIDGSTLPGISVTNLITAPTTAPTLNGSVATTGGQITGNTTVYVGYTFVTLLGETTMSNLLSVAIPAGTSTNNFFVNLPSAPTGVLGVNWYIGSTNTAGTQFFYTYTSSTSGATTQFIFQNPLLYGPQPPSTNSAYTGQLNGLWKRDIDTTATPFTITAGTPGSWSSGGFSCPDTTNSPGVYELGVPNAAMSTTGNPKNVYIALSGFTNMALTEILINYDLLDKPHYSTF